MTPLVAILVLLYVVVLHKGATATVIIEVSNELEFRTALATTDPGGNRTTITSIQRGFPITFAHPIVINGQKSIVIRNGTLSINLPRSLDVDASSSKISNHLLHSVGDLNRDGLVDSAFNNGSILLGTPASSGVDHSTGNPSALKDKRVFSVGDVNGDKTSDFAFVRQDENGLWQVRIVFGGQAFVSSNDIKEAVVTLDQFYLVRDVVGVGDVNGDGVDDLAISYSRDPFAPGAGSFKAVFLVLGSPSLAGANTNGPISISDPLALACDAQTLLPSESTGFSRLVVARAGDVDGDGFDDFLVGVPPAVFFVFGNPALESRSLQIDRSRMNRIFSASTASNFGGSIASGVDIDGDRLVDFVIGAPGSSEVVVLFGEFMRKNPFGFSTRLQADFRTLEDRLVLVGTRGEGCGSSVAARDFDGDGLGDVLVHCSLVSTPSLRRLFLVFGEDLKDVWTFGHREVNLSAIGVEMKSMTTTSRIEGFDSSVGDVDGDGFPDLFLHLDNSQTVLVKSPGQSRAELRRTKGLFILKDSASLVVDSVRVEGTQRLFTNEGSGSVFVNGSSRFTSSSFLMTSLMCPRMMDDPALPVTCPACSNSSNAQCPTPCDEFFHRKPLLGEMSTRFEFNFAGPKVVYLGSNNQLIVGFDPVSRELLANRVSLGNDDCGRIQDRVRVSQIPLATTYISLTNTDPNRRYDGSAPLLFEAVTVNQRTAAVVFLGADNNLYLTTTMTDNSKGFSRPVLLHSFNSPEELPPLQSSTVYSSTCAGSSFSDILYCFVGFYRSSARRYVQYLFRMDSNGGNNHQATTLGSTKRYPVMQLEPWTILPSGSVRGEAIYDSAVVGGNDRFLMVYYARDASTDAIGRSALYFSMFQGNDTETDRVALDSFNGDVIVSIRLVPAGSGVYLIAHSWLNRALLLYRFDGGDSNTWTRLNSNLVNKPATSPLAFDVTAISTNQSSPAVGNDSLVLVTLAPGSSFKAEVRRIQVGNDASVSVTDVGTVESKTNISIAMGFHRRLFIKPDDSSSFSYLALIQDPLASSAARRNMSDPSIAAHLMQYRSSGFPVSHRVFSKRIPNVIRTPGAQDCPVGFYCPVGSRIPCPSGSFQTTSKPSKTKREDCELNNECSPGFWCGPGAALGSTYRRIIDASSQLIEMEMLASTKRFVLWTVRNLDLAKQVRMRVIQGFPDWLSASAVFIGGDHGTVSSNLFLDEGYGLVVPPASTIQVNFTVDSTLIELESIRADLSFEWWLDGDETLSRFPLSLGFAVKFVPLLVTPAVVELDIPDASSANVAQGLTTLFNVFPTSEIRARIEHVGCFLGEWTPTPSWFEFVDPAISSREHRLLPALGQRLEVVFAVNAAEIHPGLLDPLQPVHPLRTCVRFNCTIDETIKVFSVVEIRVRAASKCPSGHFSSTGTNSIVSGCLPCPSDSFQPTPGSTACLKAPRCPRGTFSPSNGLRFNDSSCIQCAPGSYAPREGAEACLLCPRGRYSDKQGAIECYDCPDNLLGAVRDGARSILDCQASPGFFKSIGLGNGSAAVTVEPCPEGVDCAASEATLEALPVSPGYWRASLTSRTVRKCRKGRYCAGISGRNSTSASSLEGRSLQSLPNSNLSSDVYCIENHVGVLCEACPEGFAKRGSERICQKCDPDAIAHDQGTAAGVLIAILLVPILCFVLLLCYQRRSRVVKLRASTRLYACMKLVDGGTKPKLLIGLFQVVAACAVNFGVGSFPPQFLNIATSFAVFYIDTSIVIDMGCAMLSVAQGWYKTLLVTTIGPFIALLAIGILNRIIVYFLSSDRTDKEKRKQINAVTAAVSMFTVFLVYPGVSNTIIRTFICETIDDGRKVLKADFSVECDTEEWRSYVVYCAFMCIIYVIGVPVGFAWILFRNRRALNPNKSGPQWNRSSRIAAQMRDDDPGTRPLFFLTHAYIPFFYWFEPLDLVIRLVQTSVILVLEEIWHQVLFLICVTVVYLLVLVQLAPYVKWTNHVLAIICQACILVIALSALVSTLNKLETDPIALDVVCTLALFLPVLVAIPLHVIQVRNNRWNGFFDAEEMEDEDELQQPKQTVGRASASFPKDKRSGVVPSSSGEDGGDTAEIASLVLLGNNADQVHPSDVSKADNNADCHPSDFPKAVNNAHAHPSDVFKAVNNADCHPSDFPKAVVPTNADVDFPKADPFLDKSSSVGDMVLSTPRPPVPSQASAIHSPSMATPSQQFQPGTEKRIDTESESPPTTDDDDQVLESGSKTRVSPGADVVEPNETGHTQKDADMVEDGDEATLNLV